MGPALQLLKRLGAERLGSGVGAQRPHDVGDLGRGRALGELERSQLMTMQPVREVAEHRVLRIGRDTFDQQLISGNTKQQSGTLIKQRVEPEGNRIYRRSQQGVTLGIGAVLVQRDGELDQKYRKVARERGALLPGTSGGHIRLDIMRPPSMVSGTSGRAGPGTCSLCRAS